MLFYLQVLGDWLEDSGWTSALVQANIASTGTADSFVKASHVTKTRHAHQVTAASLHTLLQKAYSEYINAAEMEVLRVLGHSNARAPARTTKICRARNSKNDR